MLNSLNTTLSIILKVVFIVVLCLGATWVILAFIANAGEDDIAGLPKLPGSKADYMITMRTTGSIILTPSFKVSDSPKGNGHQVYTAHGFYQSNGKKWVWSKDDIILDEYYFGEITVSKRG
ncbi:hypothetical protein ACFLXT_02700 [Chloroflexota bacterium]